MSHWHGLCIKERLEGQICFAHLHKDKNPKVALKEIMQHISLLERKGE